MIYNRVLQSKDYDELQPELGWFAKHIAKLSNHGLNTGLNHEHRRWEYALAKHLLDAESRGRYLNVIDVGSGASPLGIGLKLLGHNVWETDSCDYGDPVQELIRQCQAFKVEIPWVPQPAEEMPDVPSDYFDVTISISVMEHVDKEREMDAWLELARITKPGGAIFATMDFHPDPTIDTPFRSIQQTIYNAAHLHEVVKGMGCQTIGATNWRYHGDMVNNYSFCSLAVRK